MLYIFAGLPGAGKMTLARQLASDVRAVYLRIDSIEQALRDAGAALNGPEGYVVAYRVAADNLRMGLSVVADSVNPVQITRTAWREVAVQSGTMYRDIEIICSDPDEHRRRVETRIADIPGFPLPTWADVQTREYHSWDIPPITLNTAGRTMHESMTELRRLLASYE